ncbi:AAA family ATPase [Flavobacterium sp. SUN046]|uniref:SbcC/MukB-like Walker B domain-containing protein n=1 Tax=Flavobacterium sp. SUN046 TaxID=3002440 RepID=UPI002DB6D950|nr:AAA family ATPase [Flavobacterium sp. SUN046]MEC4049113.1 AAA family ATPase [Flavobacterium sp. SUN046]
MLPIKLCIEGLYSYQKLQTIDFTALTEAGLFGIFGAVGSGKSSILEAIGFVLYAETERLNKTDKRSYNMLNLKSNKASIDFEFLNYEDRKFKFVANWSRKKRFDDTTTINRIAYEWKGGEWIPLESADATPIIGLSYDNFRRTIIIPQGKFKEFLDLKGKDRSDMMKEIFHLHKYDLSAKVGSLQAATKSSLDQLKGALSGFETISEETILTKEAVGKEATTLLEAYQELQKKAELEFTVLNTLKSNFEELERRKAIVSELTLKQTAMDTLQAEVAQFEKVEKSFGASLLALNQTTKVLDNAREDYSKTESSYKKIQETIDVNEKALILIQPYFDQLEASKQRVLDLESIAKVLKFNTESDAIGLKVEVEEKAIAVLTIREQEDKGKLDSLLKEVAALKSTRTDTSILLAVGQWFMQHFAHQKNLTESIEHLKTTTEKISISKDSFIALGLSIDSWKEDLKAKSEVLEATKKELEASKNKLLVAKELAQFSHNLHDGESCPLCGALEHPNPMQIADVSHELSAIEVSIQELAQQGLLIKETFAKAQKAELERSHLEGQLALLEKAKEDNEKEQAKHLQTFVWTAFSPTDFASFEAQKQAQEQLEASIKTLEATEKAIRAGLDKTGNDLKILRANQSQIKSDLAVLSGAIANELSQLKVLSYHDYENKEAAVIQSEKTTLEARNAKVASEYQLKSDALAAAKKDAAELKGRMTSQKELVDATANQLKETNDLIEGLLIAHQFDSIESVQLILNKHIDVIAEKEKLNQFVIQLQTAKNLVEDSEKLVAGQVFDKDSYAIKETAAKEAKEAVNVQIGVVATLESELATMKKELAEKADLLKQLNQLQSRADNLTTLSNMFNGAGFVNYVSSIYLQNLADVANVRFHRMTKNQLSLQINSSNEFEVLDYLNNGASRSVKTLSGGQGFQASLCLALALAESVQSLKKNNKNFFFIDEGFGTQDPESVAVVFETLQSLYKENRIVGIISHVAELQERIPRSINVVKDEEKGSEVVVGF